MTNEHITRFEVSNFKKFDRLVVENIGQVNLITGDNNVGKTSLLEVLLLEPDMRIALSALNYMVLSRSKDAHTLLKFEIGKEEENQKNNLVGVHQNNIAKDLVFEYSLTSGERVGFKIRNRIKSNYLSEAKTYANLIKTDINLIDNWLDLFNTSKPRKKNSDGEEEYIMQLYIDPKREVYRSYLEGDFDFPILKLEDFTISKHQRCKDILDRYAEVIQTGSTETKFIKILNAIFPLKINAIRIGVDELEIRTQEQDEYRRISQYGDGFIKGLKIILLILRGNSPRVMIDEIDAGIHFSKLKNFWMNFLILAKETNTQLFCTTHSQDCIKAFVEAGDEMSEMKDRLRLIELEEFSSEAKLKHTATTYEFDALKYKLEVGTNVRGGDVWQ